MYLKSKKCIFIKKKKKTISKYDSCKCVQQCENINKSLKNTKLLCV